MVDCQYIKSVYDQIHYTWKLYFNEMYQSYTSVCEEVWLKRDKAGSVNICQGVDCQGF